jgi:hypothetical protein
MIIDGYRVAMYVTNKYPWYTSRGKFMVDVDHNRSTVVELAQPSRLGFSGEQNLPHKSILPSLLGRYDSSLGAGFLELTDDF